MKALVASSLKGDPNFEVTLNSWLSNPAQDFILRKQVLIFQWTEKKVPLTSLLAHFNSRDQVKLVQNLLNTPRYRDTIVKNEDQIPGLLALVRGSRKVRDILIHAYYPSLFELIVMVLESQEFSNDRAQAIVAEIKASFDFFDINETVKLLKLVARSDIESDFENALLRACISSINSNATLGRSLAASLNSRRPIIQRLARRIAEWSEKLDDSLYPILRVFRKIIKFHESGGGEDSLGMKQTVDGRS